MHPLYPDNCNSPQSQKVYQPTPKSITLNNNLNNRPPLLINPTPSQPKRPAPLIQPNFMRDNPLLNNTHLPAPHQLNRSRVRMPIIPKHPDDINLPERRRTNRNRLDGVPHPDLRKD